MFAAHFRFQKIKKVGMWGYDTFVFASQGQDWVQGTYINRYGKIGFETLNALGIKILGYHDYTTRYVTAFSDTPRIRLLNFLLFRSKKCWIRSGMSSLRSRKDGTWTGIAFRR